MLNLSERLLCIAGLINEGERVADIGTDHAYLPIYLRQSGKCPHVLACDIKQLPLESAKRNVEDCHADGIDFRLCDGLSGIYEDEVDCVVIAGMGGECIAGILKNSWSKYSNKRFILQPMNSPEFLREYLQNDYTVLSERAVTDCGRTYTVLEVLAAEDNSKKPEGFIFTGLLDPRFEEDRRFLQKQLKRLSSCAEELSSVSKEKEKRDYYVFACDAIKKRLSEV